MLRHIVVEGVDGSGKSTLVQELARWNGGYFTIPEKRSSTSLGGPVPELDQWVENQARLSLVTPPTIYDRHPLISEPIYGPTCRKKLPGRFNSPTWLGLYRDRLAHQALVIWCVPPLTTVIENIKNTQQMPGVATHIGSLWQQYRRASLIWPGVQIRYNYTTTSVQSVLSHISTVFGETRDRAA